MACAGAADIHGQLASMTRPPFAKRQFGPGPELPILCLLDTLRQP